jgi:plastocyanin
MQRRTFLTGTAAALTPAIAGCGGGGGNGNGNGNGNGDTPTDGGETTTTADDGMTTTEADETTTTDSGTPTEEPPSELTVELTSSSFDPLQARVAVGGTVEWVNEDSYGHDVTSAQYSDSAVDWDYSESLGGGESVSRTFDSAGVYEYYCTIHGEGNMCGVVVVGDVSYDGSLPCGDGGGGVDY